MVVVFKGVNFIAMKNRNYQNLIDPKKYQVFVLCCPANIPVSFASHSWFVCNEKGNVSRWEILFWKNKDKSWGHLHLNQFPPFSGIEIWPFSSRWLWKSRLLSVIEGDLAKRTIDLIKTSKESYPNSKKYSLVRVNSNTYVRWVLKHFPEIDLKFPWNAFGEK